MALNLKTIFLHLPSRAQGLQASATTTTVLGAGAGTPRLRHAVQALYWQHYSPCLFFSLPFPSFLSFSLLFPSSDHWPLDPGLSQGSTMTDSPLWWEAPVSLSLCLSKEKAAYHFKGLKQLPRCMVLPGGWTVPESWSSVSFCPLVGLCWWQQQLQRQRYLFWK